MIATFSAYLNRSDFITLLLIAEEYKLWNFSLCNFYPSVTQPDFN
jgi:hypothetical protein